MKRKIENQNRASPSDRFAQLGAGLILKIQRKSMAELQKLFERMPARARQLVLVLGFLGAAAFCTGLLINPGNDSDGMPGSGNLFKEAPFAGAPAIPLAGERAVLLRIRRAGSFLDSLEQTASGRLKRDSILRGRPGLRDSLKLVEELYKGIVP